MRQPGTTARTPPVACIPPHQSASVNASLRLLLCCHISQLQSAPASIIHPVPAWHSCCVARCVSFTKRQPGLVIQCQPGTPSVLPWQMTDRMPYIPLSTFFVHIRLIRPLQICHLCFRSCESGPHGSHRNSVIVAEMRAGCVVITSYHVYLAPC